MQRLYMSGYIYKILLAFRKNIYRTQLVFYFILSKKSVFEGFFGFFCLGSSYTIATLPTSLWMFVWVTATVGTCVSEGLSLFTLLWLCSVLEGLGPMAADALGGDRSLRSSLPSSLGGQCLLHSGCCSIRGSWKVGSGVPGPPVIPPAGGRRRLPAAAQL